MWVIFLIVCIVVALAGFVVAWIGNKIYLSIQRDNLKFEKEQKAEEKENEE